MSGAEYIFDGPPIQIGLPWSIVLQVEGASLFPVGVAITAHVRRQVSDASPVATLSTGTGTIHRDSDTQLTLSMTAEQTALMQPGSVVTDLVRTDGPAHAYMGLQLTIPVAVPVTRL